MGYERKSMQIVGGGWTCLPPVDKIPITDYLLCQNFRSDSLGRLVSRPGYALKIAMQNAGIAHSGAVSGTPGEYFVAANADSTGAGGTVWYGGVGGQQIASGFDGNRVAFSLMNGFMWIMNRGNQGRSAGAASFETWTLSTPQASPGVAAGGAASVSAQAVYTYAPQTQPYTHFLSIGGTTYSFPELGYGPDQVALVISVIAGKDPNCTVTYPGTGQQVTIAPIQPDATISVSGSDGNVPVNLSQGATPGTAPQGTYVVYFTFQSSDLTLESNPGPGSQAITIDNQTIVITIPATAVPTDPRVGFLNIYVSGGTLPGAYRVAQLPWTSGSSPTTYTWTVDESSAVNAGVVMPADNDLPPAAAGMIGPHFGRLYAWSTREHPNRVFWTPPDQPQYWPGSHDEQIGNWVDVGLDDEAIVWATIHANLIIFYKQRSIWMLIGSDPGSAQLEQAYSGAGLVNQWALASAGQVDYFVAPNGLKLFDMSMVHDLSADILPIFNTTISNTSMLEPPGSMLPGGTVNTGINQYAFSAYAVTLGHAFDRLFISYAEQGGGFPLLVFDEGPAPEGQTLLRPSGRWFYERNGLGGTTGFYGYIFDGTYMIGLTGAAADNAAGYSLADFQSRVPTDYNATLIECVYGSHYEDCGLPEQDKMWLEVVIDYEYGTGGSAAQVYLGFNAGKIAPYLIGTLPGSTRQSVAFAPGGLPGGTDAGFLARSMAVFIDALTGGTLTIHNVYLYYYVEARTARVASAIPTDLGVGKIKQCKELQLDIDATGGAVGVNIVSDLPGNALAIRQSPTVAQGGRAIWKYPFATTEGLLWQLSLASVNLFRLYSARLLMRVLEIAVEGYETTNGFVWDSMEQALGGGEVSTVDQVRFEMDSDGTSQVQVITDLPGEAQTSKGTYTLTAGITSRAWVLVPMPDGVEARSVRLEVTGTAGFRLYRVQVRHARIGRYLSGMTPSGVDDSFRALEVDLHSERFGHFKRLEIDMRANAVVTVTVYTDQDTQPLAVMYTTTFTTSGRAAQVVPLPPGIRGRLMRVKLISDSPARVYRIRVWTRPVSDPAAGWAWADFPLETSDVLATWTDFIADETSPKWEWAEIDMSVSE
jgi:hypothetical protein